MAIPGRSSPETGEAKASKAERKRTKMRKAQSESGARGAEPGKGPASRQEWRAACFFPHVSF